MTVFPFKPLQAGYTVGFSSGLISTSLDGGLPRTRLDVQGNPRPVTATWVLDGDDVYNLFQGYMRNYVRSGGAPVEIKLILDSAEMQSYEAVFTGEPPYSLSGKNGQVYTVTASLLVLPLDRYQDPDTDDYGLVAKWIGDTYSDPFVAGKVLNLLDRLVNVSLPHE